MNSQANPAAVAPSARADSPGRRTEISFYALRRSGSHAVIQWIASHFQSVDFFNNLHPWDVDFVNEGRMSANFCTEISTLVPTSQDHLCIYNFESKPAQLVLKRPCTLVPGSVSFRVVLLRDFFNNIASLLAKREGLTIVPDIDDMPSMRFYRDLWVSYADLVRHNEDVTFVNFNEWVVSRPYRQMIARTFADRYVEDTMRFIPRHGGGSSFGTSVFSPAQYLTRYRGFMRHPNMLSFLSDDVLMNHCREIFPGITEEIISFCRNIHPRPVRRKRPPFLRRLYLILLSPVYTYFKIVPLGFCRVFSRWQMWIKRMANQ